MPNTRSTKRRIVPVAVSYEAEIKIPFEIQEEVNRQAAAEVKRVTGISGFTFSSSDFRTLEYGLSLCKATWLQRKHAPKKAAVVNHFTDVAAKVDELRELIQPKGDLSAAAAFATSRFRIHENLDDMAKKARTELELLKGTHHELQQGSDGVHLDELLDHVRFVLDRAAARLRERLRSEFGGHFGCCSGLTQHRCPPDHCGLSTTFTTKNGERHALAADIAAVLSKLLPSQVQDSPPQAIASVFLNRLVETRRLENRLGTKSYLHIEEEDWDFVLDLP